MRASTHGTSVHVLVGGCGSGRTERLQRLHHELGPRSSQYIDLERVSTTPERCFRAVMNASPFVHNGVQVGGAQAAGAASVSASGQLASREASGARPAFDAMLMFLMNASAADGGPATFLLDEILELRTFESFPGLRSVLRDLIASLAAAGNRFVLTSRYSARALRVLRDAPQQFEIIHVAPLSAAEIRSTLPTGSELDRAATGVSEAEDDRARDEFARLVQSLSEGLSLIHI